MTPGFILSLLVWFLLALPWFVLDGWLAGRLSWAPDLTVVLALVAGLHVRARAVAAFLLCAASARALIMDGTTGLHFLALGIPVAVLLGLRRTFVERSLLWHGMAAAMVAWSLPLLTAVFARLGRIDLAPPPVDWFGVLRAVVWGPLIAAGMARVPPWRAFRRVRAGRGSWE